MNPSFTTLVGQWFEKKMGPHWKVLVSGIGSLVMGVLTFLAAIPYQIEELGMIVPPWLKKWMIIICGSAASVLKVWNYFVTKGKQVSGPVGHEMVSTKVAEARPVIQEEPLLPPPKLPPFEGPKQP